jgi:hypothetical protein
VDYFNKFKGFNFISPESSIKPLQDKTLLAFHAYSHEFKQKKMDKVGKLMEKDPVSFGKMLETACAQAEKDSTSLSEEQAMYVEFANTVASSFVMYWPDIEQGQKLLTKCIWTRYSLDKFKKIATPMSHRHFADIFKEEKT